MNPDWDGVMRARAREPKPSVRKMIGSVQWDQPIFWLGVYKRWLRHRATILDGIWFADVRRLAREHRNFAFVGPVVYIEKEEL